jgi:hypothetical protein
VLQSQPTQAPLESGELERVPIRERILTVAFELWLDSWEAALAALATASQDRTLSTNETAAHKALIAAERELVTREFTLLLGHITGGDLRTRPLTPNSEVHQS